MDASRKSFETQAHIRHNAEEFRNTLKDLYSWEKEIKDVEMKMQSQVESQPNLSQQQTKVDQEPIEADEAPMMLSSLDSHVILMNLNHYCNCY